MTGCDTPLIIAVTALSLALVISLGFNIIFCIRRRDRLCRDKNDCCYIYREEGPPQEEEEHYFRDSSRREQQENPHDHHEQQENPIYGNISTDRGSVDVCYETMTTQHTRSRLKPSEPDLNYASLDLKLAKKRKKKYRNRHEQTRNSHHGTLPGHLTPPGNTFLDADEHVDAHLPPRNTVTTMSHSSIYLNSQQIAHEAEELEREWDNVGWDGMRRQEDGGNRDWDVEQEMEQRNDRHGVDNGTVSNQMSDSQAAHSSTDHFNSSFSVNSERQD